MGKPTAGKWWVSTKVATRVVVGTTDDNFLVAACEGNVPTEEAKANAILIAQSKKMLDELRAYVKAQSRMLERWSEGDDAVKADLWTALHSCEEPARAAIAAATEGE